MVVPELEVLDLAVVDGVPELEVEVVALPVVDVDVVEVVTFPVVEVLGLLVVVAPVVVTYSPELKRIK